MSNIHDVERDTIRVAEAGESTGSELSLEGRDQPDLVTNSTTAEDSIATPVAEIRPFYEPGLIPAENIQHPALADPPRVHFEPNPEEVDDPVRGNLSRLLQEPAFRAFASSLPVRVAPESSYDPIPISARETHQELFGALDGRAAEEVQGNVPPAHYVPTISGSSGPLPRFSSKVGTVPMPTRPSVIQPLEPPTSNDSNQTVTCTFGSMENRVNGIKSPSFVSEILHHTDASRFSQIFASEAAGSVGLMFLVITNWQAWFLPHLAGAIPAFPGDTVLNLSRSRETTMLPLIDNENGELSCIMEHVNIDTEATEESPRGFRVGTTEVHFSSLVVWTSAKHLTVDGPRPLVVIISPSYEDIDSKISTHYSQAHHERWNRLEGNQTWVYLDLYFLFTRWDRVWGVIKHNLSARIEEVHSRKQAVSIIEQTRQLHIDNNVMISLREHLRIHKASIQVVIQRVKNRPDIGLPGARLLSTRLDDASQLLDYYDVTATSLLEQQQNLLSLTFNLETAIQGQAVARLNALAFIFLPLSLVATIFGITTFTAPPKWYPVAAAPVVVITIAIAWIANKLLESGSFPRQVIKSGDIERLPTKGINSTEPSRISGQRGILRGRKGLSQIFSQSRAKLDAPTSINDPSRVSKPVPGSSLPFVEGETYVPPSSTFQILPRVTAYPPTRPPNQYYRQEETRLQSAVPQAQEERQQLLPPQLHQLQLSPLVQDSLFGRLDNPTSQGPSLTFSFNSAPNTGSLVGDGDTTLSDTVNSGSDDHAQDDPNADTDIGPSLAAGVAALGMARPALQESVALPTTVQIAALDAPTYTNASEQGTLETIPENIEH